MGWQVARADGFDAGCCNRVVVLDGATGHADGADQDAFAIDDRQTAWERDQPVVGMLDAKQRAAGLRQLADLAGRHAEKDGGFGLFDSDVDRADPRAIHAVKRLQVGARVDDRDAHLRIYSLGLLDGSLDRDIGIFAGHMHRSSLPVRPRALLLRG